MELLGKPTIATESFQELGRLSLFTTKMVFPERSKFRLSVI